MTTPITITIPAADTAPGTYNLKAKGRYFLVTALNGSFNVVTNQGDTYSIDETGSGFGDTKSPIFASLNFYNATGSAVTITFYVSLYPIKTSDVTVQSSVTVSSAITNVLADCTPAALNSSAIGCAAANTAYQFSGASVLFRKIIILAYKSFGTAGNPPTANTGQVFIGVGSIKMPIALNPGDVWDLEAPTGASYNLNEFYISAANAGDGILVIYS